MRTYLVEKNSRMLELLSMEEIHRCLLNGKLNHRCRIYNDDSSSWISLREHPDFRRGLTQVPAPLQPRDWYYLQGAIPIGAFSYLEMIRMLQKKRLPSNTAVWRQGMSQWTPAMLIQEFHPTVIQQVHKSGVPGIQNYFAGRRYQRFPYAAKFVLHNEQKLWRAVSYELSPGGIGLLVNSADLQPGQEVFVHKTSAGGMLSINAVGMVVSKSTNGLRPGHARYGLEFVDISKESQLEIAALVGQMRALPSGN